MRELISAFLDGECTKTETEIVREHLRACPDCRAYHERLSSTLRMLRDLPQERPGSDSLTRTARALKNESAAEMRHSTSLSAALLWTGAVAAAVVIAVIVLFATPAPTGPDEAADTREDVERRDVAVQPEKRAPKIHDEKQVVEKKADKEPGIPEEPREKEEELAETPKETTPAPAEKDLTPEPEKKVADAHKDIKTDVIEDSKTPPEKKLVETKGKTVREKVLAVIAGFNGDVSAGNVAGQVKAVRALAGLKTGETCDFLATVLENEAGDFKPVVRMEAVHTLGTINTGRSAVLLFTAYDDSFCEVAFSVPEALGKITCDDAVNLYIKKFKTSTNREERRLAAETLGKAGNPLALGVLKNAAKKEKDITVRGAAIEALGRLGVERKFFENLLKGLRGNGRRWYLRQAAVRALGYLGDDESVDTLMKALKDRSFFVREAAARSLGRLGLWESLESIQAAMKSAQKRGRLYGELVRAGVNITEDISFGKPPTFRFQTSEGGITAYTGSVLFLVDVSSSMPFGGKMKWLEAELSRSLETLRPSQKYNFMVFANNTKLIYTRPLTANSANFAKTLKDLPKILKTQQGTQSDFFAAFSRAFETGADTIVFISDGYPTAGKITASTPFVRTVTSMNRQRQCVIHTVGLHNSKSGKLTGRPEGEGVDLMRTLAKQNGGTFIYEWFIVKPDAPGWKQKTGSN